jgi:hypothetical protein
MAPTTDTNAESQPLVEELQRRFALDQEARRRVSEVKRRGIASEYAEAEAEVRRIDADNTAWLRDLLDRRGWPLRSEVGESASVGAWVIAQHADADPTLQRRALSLMEPLMAQDEVDKSHVAMLTDRVLLAEGKRQRYGTQCVFDADAGWVCRPCESPELLDRRRAEMGLKPISDYLIDIANVYP